MIFPSTINFPFDGFSKPNIKFAVVVFPLPVLPTKAIFVPFFISIFSGHIREDFGLSHAAWSGIYALGTTASAFVMIWAGVLTDVLRTRILGVIVFLGLALASAAMVGVNVAVDVFFVADVALNFHTAVVEDGFLVISKVRARARASRSARSPYSSSARRTTRAVRTASASTRCSPPASAAAPPGGSMSSAKHSVCSSAMSAAWTPAGRRGVDDARPPPSCSTSSSSRSRWTTSRRSRTTS